MQTFTEKPEKLEAPISIGVNMNKEQEPVLGIENLVYLTIFVGDEAVWTDWRNTLEIGKYLPYSRFFTWKHGGGFFVWLCTEKE